MGPRAVLDRECDIETSVDGGNVSNVGPSTPRFCRAIDGSLPPDHPTRGDPGVAHPRFVSQCLAGALPPFSKPPMTPSPASRALHLLLAIASPVALAVAQPAVSTRPATPQTSSNTVTSSTSALRPMTWLDMQNMQQVGSPAVSPNGEWMAYTLSTPDWRAARRQSDLYVVSTQRGVPSTRRLTYTTDKSEN